MRVYVARGVSVRWGAGRGPRERGSEDAETLQNPVNECNLTTVLFTHYPQELRGKVHDYVNPLAIQINVSVVCKHED